ncbi:beta-lactamase-like protein [Leptodontidium sp. MPI-SDFR-AT-0119]|nr:beta-lactamase-like protein [Leptodontidium sp. MPI-SDFR-AT-0119]
MGVPIIEKAFPDAQFVATGNVVAGIKELYATVFDAVWPNLFPGQLHDSKPVPKALAAGGEFLLDGHKICGVEVGHTDNEYSSFLHVPSLRLVVSGDIVYGECHQHFAEANTKAKRQEWLDAIDRIEALNPQIVVPGHKRATEIDGAYLMQSTREYIHHFERELSRATSWESLFDRMVALYPQRWNLFILEYGCQQSFAVVEKERL